MPRQRDQRSLHLAAALASLVCLAVAPIRAVALDYRVELGLVLDFEQIRILFEGCTDLGPLETLRDALDTATDLEQLRAVLEMHGIAHFSGCPELRNQVSGVRVATAFSRSHPSGRAAPDTALLQAALALLGINPGPTDGILGSRTRAAIRQFQEERGLSAHGNPDSELRVALAEVLSQKYPNTPEVLEIALALLAQVPGTPSPPPRTETSPTKPQTPTRGLARVSYLRDSIAQKEETAIRLLGGSWWLFARPSLALVTDEVTIVLQDETSGVAFLKRERIPVRHLRGVFVAEAGFFGEVVAALSGGAILKLNDGSLWSIPSYDQYDTGWWLPPYPAIVTSNEMYIINVEEGRRVWANRLE